jgi:hypothetical protein
LITPNYPVRVRVFDESGGALTEGAAMLPWGMLTNGLVDLCRISLAIKAGVETGDGLVQADPSVSVSRTLHPLRRKNRQESKLETASAKPSGRSESPAASFADAGDQESEDRSKKFTENEELMRSVSTGFLWMMAMFDQLRTVPAVHGIWDKVRYAVRLPNLKTVAAGLLKGRLQFTLHPRFEEVSEFTPPNEAERYYRLPVDMNFGKQNLGRLDIILGQPDGAEVLLSGIRSIQAVHPDQPQQELMAQLLATGRAGEGR